MRAMSVANVWIYRATGGRVGGRWRMGSARRRPAPVCLLTTRGRKTGRLRTVPLLYLRDGGRVVVVASQGGLPTHPQWYLNLRRTPRVTVQTGDDIRLMTARTASPEERAALWPRLVEMYADYDDYQSRTDREIPVVICDPA
ncbi:nitroreductase family deazaflavin-dependent oxidoreductase [Bailinhaonella thermotolerans]|uniref:Nitroreductase family deazaflavin-dependent oxidoreductase n=2 Tax=Bailinhaonella thermotolerans TaxID=1070861 RepID=A0A3A4AZY6_9ACTN|nr:nitroreductase family deazaflavin-dependent oxidoreductase [Bailinhaonella thermotolerans]